MMILSEFQDGTRNARVYRMKNGSYGVECYDADTDETKFTSVTVEEDAEIAAENWVLRHEPI
jgi:hypothetical protein